MTTTIAEKLSATQLDVLEKFADRTTKLNILLAVFDPNGDCILDFQPEHFAEDHNGFGDYARMTFEKSDKDVCRFGDHDEIFSVILRDDEHSIAAAIIDTGPAHQAEYEELQRLCHESGLDYTMLEKTFLSCSRENDYISEMLSTLAKDFKAASKAARQLEIVSSELTQTYQELMLLHNMSSNMKVTQSNGAYLQMACDQITQSVHVEGIAVFLEKQIQGEKNLVLKAGSGVVTIDHEMADILQVYLSEEMNNGKEALLDSQADDSPFKYHWPDEVRNIIAVPLQGNERIIGMMVATNIVDKPEFDKIDVKLFNSVAHQCTIFIENGRLFNDLKELFMGSLKALTNSIDAKDQYTRGHSDRVAFISRWIADEVAKTESIPEEEIHRIYLAGLLHDIGKIGVDEVVLRKKGKLVAEDMDQIKAHPRIGAAILAEIKQMEGIVPGVLYHHERIDGKGYPKGLVGDEIPRIGRIIGLADAFDAMTSKRLYRDAMSTKRALREIKKGLGTQFDKEFGTIFIESDIDRLWSIIQDGFIESWDYSNFSEYGTVAVGTLLR